MTLAVVIPDASVANDPKIASATAPFPDPPNTLTFGAEQLVCCCV